MDPPDHTESDPSMEQTDQIDQMDSNSQLVECMFSELKKYEFDEYYGPGLVAMAKQFNRMGHNPAKLLSAMHCFGKALNTATRRSKTIRRPARRPGPMIPAQPSAVMRRSHKSGSKRRLTPGRSRKQTRGPEHPYCSGNGNKKRPARFGHHQLAESVAMNCSHQK